MKSGIYEIVGPTGPRYVGSSKDIPSRWAAHRRALVKGTHHNPHLQREWFTHGERAFLFHVIEYVSESELHIREQHYINARGFMNLCNLVKTPGVQPFWCAGWRAKREAEQFAKQEEARARGAAQEAEAEAREAAVAKVNARVTYYYLAWRERHDRYVKRLLREAKRSAYLARSAAKTLKGRFRVLGAQAVAIETQTSLMFAYRNEVRTERAYELWESRLIARHRTNGVGKWRTVM